MTSAVAKLLANWRATHEPGETIGSKGAFKYDIQRQCADELETALRQEGQAGVSAEAVAKLVEKWEHDYDIYTSGEPGGERQSRIHSPKCHRCELEQALATAPPEQADFALPEQRDLTPDEQKALRRVYAKLYKPADPPTSWSE